MTSLASASLLHPKTAHPSRYLEPHHPQDYIIIQELFERSQVDFSPDSTGNHSRSGLQD